MTTDSEPERRERRAHLSKDKRNPLLLCRRLSAPRQTASARIPPDSNTVEPDSVRASRRVAVRWLWSGGPTPWQKPSLRSVATFVEPCCCGVLRIYLAELFAVGKTPHPCSGRCGDLVLTLRDGSKLEIRSLPDFERNYNYIRERTSAR